MSMKNIQCFVCLGEKMDASAFLEHYAHLHMNNFHIFKCDSCGIKYATAFYAGYHFSYNCTAKFKTFNVAVDLCDQDLHLRHIELQKALNTSIEATISKELINRLEEKIHSIDTALSPETTPQQYEHVSGSTNTYTITNAEESSSNIGSRSDRGTPAVRERTSEFRTESAEAVSPVTSDTVNINFDHGIEEEEDTMCKQITTEQPSPASPVEAESVSEVTESLDNINHTAGENYKHVRNDIEEDDDSYEENSEHANHVDACTPEDRPVIERLIRELIETAHNERTATESDNCADADNNEIDSPIRQLNSSTDIEEQSQRVNAVEQENDQYQLFTNDEHATKDACDKEEREELQWAEIQQKLSALRNHFKYGTEYGGIDNVVVSKKKKKNRPRRKSNKILKNNNCDSNTIPNRILEAKPTRTVKRKVKRATKVCTTEIDNDAHRKAMHLTQSGTPCSNQVPPDIEDNIVITVDFNKTTNSFDEIELEEIDEYDEEQDFADQSEAIVVNHSSKVPVKDTAPTDVTTDEEGLLSDTTEEGCLERFKHQSRGNQSGSTSKHRTSTSYGATATSKPLDEGLQIVTISDSEDEPEEGEIVEGDSNSTIVKKETIDTTINISKEPTEQKTPTCGKHKIVNGPEGCYPPRKRKTLLETPPILETTPKEHIEASPRELDVNDFDEVHEEDEVLMDRLRLHRNRLRERVNFNTEERKQYRREKVATYKHGLKKSRRH